MISQVVPWGDNKPFMTALVVPDFDGLASALGRPAPRTAEQRKALCATGAGVELVMGRIDSMMNDLASFKRIKKIYLHADELSQEAGEMTPTLKVKMKVIKEKFGPKLDALYN